MIRIAAQCVVAMRYIMKNSAGDILENTLKADPVCYLHGSSSILDSLQQQMEGLKAGDKKTIYLSKHSGLTTDDFIFNVIIDQVRLASAEEILLGYPVQAPVEACNENCACYENTGADNTEPL